MYAAKTQVSCARSRAEIEDIVTRYGATGFVCGYDGDTAAVMFIINQRQVKFVLHVPSKDDKCYRFVGKRRRQATTEEALKLWEQDCRQKWRALALCIKAKLETCASGILTFEEEFLPHFVCKDGRTVAQSIIPQLDSGLKNGRLMLTEGHV